MPGSKNQRTDRTSSESGSRGAHIVNEVILRDQVQVALYELLHGYEEMTGLSVIRVHYDSERGRVSIDALPRT